jgi:hypothetical protein
MPDNLSRSERLRFHARKLQRHPALRRWKQSVRAVTSLVPSTWRRMTQPFRELPSAIIVGAQKAGTTQLYSYLTTHPRVFPASCKEVNYFSLHAERPVEWYRAQFPFTRRVAAVGGQAIEASPSYLPNPAAMRRMHAVLPNARIIALVRDPVARAFSHYQHAKARGRETRTFEQAVQDELRQNAFPPRLGIALRAEAPPMLGYVARGYYAPQLELVLALFGRKRVLILDSADLFADTAGTCQRVFEFLRLNRHDVQPGKVYNRGYYQEKIDPTTAQRLREHYRPYDTLLVQLVGQSFRWMHDAAPLAA